MPTFYSNGKLLLTGEYVVLDGAKALAIPTKFGQSLTVEPSPKKALSWQSLDLNGTPWFEDEFTFESLCEHNISKQPSSEISKTLLEILRVIARSNKTLFKNYKEDSSQDKGLKITSQLNFERHWGLGSSSTLINNLARWSQMDAYKLLEATFGGSGYDIACAQQNHPLTYQLLAPGKRHVAPVVFNPPFKDQLYFVYLNQKQNSREGIRHYQLQQNNTKTLVSDISWITSQLIESRTLKNFCALLEQHETLISKAIHTEPVKARLFNDFKGSVKSLGAWGGDFVLAASETNPEAYFKQKGYTVIIPYANMAK